MTFLLPYLNVNFNFNFIFFVYGSWICIFLWIHLENGLLQHNTSLTDDGLTRSARREAKHQLLDLKSTSRAESCKPAYQQSIYLNYMLLSIYSRWQWLAVLRVRWRQWFRWERWRRRATRSRVWKRWQKRWLRGRQRRRWWDEWSARSRAKSASGPPLIPTPDSRFGPSLSGRRWISPRLGTCLQKRESHNDNGKCSVNTCEVFK